MRRDIDELLTESEESFKKVLEDEPVHLEVSQPVEETNPTVEDEVDVGSQLDESMAGSDAEEEQGRDDEEQHEEQGGDDLARQHEESPEDGAAMGESSAVSVERSD